MINIRFREKTNTWPGFVDLFSNLVIILIFLLIVFVFLWTTTSVFNKSTGAKTVADLRKVTAEQAETITQMTADEQEATRLLVLARNELGTYETRVAHLQQAIDTLTVQLGQALVSWEQNAIMEQERKQMQADIESQRDALVAELHQLQAQLDAAEAKSAAQEIQYVEMSGRLNKALADKVAELNKVGVYQSDFYRAIKTALGDRTTIRADGDRFIVSSDILFSSGQYTLSPEGKNQLRLIANVIKDLENKIPTDVNWIIRVDGHTDKKPVLRGTRGYSNNTELSLLRATAVAKQLAADGVSPRRLVPSGFGELHPIELGGDAASLQKNRRIELQLTNR